MGNFLLTASAVCVTLLLGPFAAAANVSASQFTGVPEFTFKETSTKGEQFDSAAAMAKCRKVLPLEKAKVLKLGFTVVAETPCYVENNTVSSFVAGSFQFLGKH